MGTSLASLTGDVLDKGTSLTGDVLDSGKSLTGNVFGVTYRTILGRP